MSTPEIEVYVQELNWILNQIGACLVGLTSEQLDWRPSNDANSPNAIVSHVEASTRVYALGFGCGLEVERDRSAEFNVHGNALDTIFARLRQLSSEIELALPNLSAQRLEERFVPSQDLYGADEPREMSRREALVESIRHSALHLGELRLTRDLAITAT